MSGINETAKVNPDITILLVDDDALVKTVLEDYLKEMGFNRVVPAKNSEQALKIVKDNKHHIDLIISDWEMPHVTGLTLLKAVRNNPERAKTPFILVTSQRSMERFKITQAAQWKVSAYIVKPFRSDTLKQKIMEVMGWAESV